jgi:hypothetical protein
MNGKVDANRLRTAENYPWNIAFWMGGWDGDALCGYIKGTWTIPLAKKRLARDESGRRSRPRRGDRGAGADFMTRVSIARSCR